MCRAGVILFKLVKLTSENKCAAHAHIVHKRPSKPTMCESRECQIRLPRDLQCISEVLEVIYNEPFYVLHILDILCIF